MLQLREGNAALPAFNIQNGIIAHFNSAFRHLLCKLLLLSLIHISVQSLACFGGYDINNFDAKMQKENSASQTLMMLKAIFSIKWFAKSNKKISAYTLQAQKDFYEMNIQFSKKSFMYLSSLSSMVNVRQTEPRKYPLLIGCGKYDIPMELSACLLYTSLCIEK